MIARADPSPAVSPNPPGSPVVTGLAMTAVKGMRVGPVAEIRLGDHGARGDRRFYVIDERGEMVNGKRFGALQAVAPHYDIDADELTLTFPGGHVARGPVVHQKPIVTRFFSRPREASPLQGPWADALSEFVGHPLRLVDGGSAVDRGRKAGASLISRASLQRLAAAAGRNEVDARRFRMLIEIDGVAAHAEDGWVERRVRIGPAVVKFNGHVGRCMVTTRNPESGDVDLQTLHALAEYRRDEPTTEPLPFGVYGQVLEGGTVRLGDHVALDG